MVDVSTSQVPHEIVLSRPPGMLGQYLRAALPSFGGARSQTLPASVLRLVGLRPQAADVARYAAVVGHAPSDKLPLLYPHLLGFGLQLKLMSDPTFPFPVMGLVHVTNEVTCSRPLRLGGVLDVAVHAENLRPHPRGRLVDLVTNVSEDGDPIWREVSSYLRREKVHGDAASTGDSAKEGEAGADELVQLNPSAVWRLPSGLGRQYGAVSGDVNPIHLSAWSAKPLGFPRAIAHGMWTAAAVLGALAGRMPDALSYAVQFRRPILLPSTVRLFTAVGESRVDAEVRGKPGDDRVHLVGSVRPL
jgi:acyl dehydratase